MQTGRRTDNGKTISPPNFRYGGIKMHAAIEGDSDIDLDQLTSLSIGDHLNSMVNVC